MPEIHFDERIAALYDASVADRFDPSVVEPAVAFLAELARDGEALELGIGTGRVALPLHERGVPVIGIDVSRPMVERMRAKPGGTEIDVTIGDFATTALGRTFSLVYLVFNTIENLTSQDEQVACFAQAADHLEPGGSFVIEVGVPPLQRLTPGERHVAFDVSPTHLGFDTIDVADQRLVSTHHWVVDGRSEVFSSPFRYVWPSELDLMARLAGLSLTGRWGGWNHEPFTNDSSSHISVWRKPA